MTKADQGPVDVLGPEPSVHPRAEGIVEVPAGPLPQSHGLADSVLVLGIADPRIPWFDPLTYALTAASLIDLETAGRVEVDDRGSVLVRDDQPTRSKGHDLVLTRIGGSNREWGPGTWIMTISPQVSRALLANATERGLVTSRDRRIMGLWTHTGYYVSDSGQVKPLRQELQRVFDGTVTDPASRDLLAICAEAGFTTLLPQQPPRKELRRVTRQFRSSPIVEGLRDAIQSSRYQMSGG